LKLFDACVAKAADISVCFHW